MKAALNSSPFKKGFSGVFFSLFAHIAGEKRYLSY